MRLRCGCDGWAVERVEDVLNAGVLGRLRGGRGLGSVVDRLVDGDFVDEVAVDGCVVVVDELERGWVVGCG